MRLAREVRMVLTAAGIILILAAVAWLNSGANIEYADSAFVVVCFALIAVGEIVRLHLRHGLIAPLSTATAGALALAPIGPLADSLGTAEVLLTVAAGMFVGAVGRAVRDMPISPLDMACRLIGVAVTTALARSHLLGAGDILTWAANVETKRWQAGLGLILVAGVGVATELGVWTIIRSRTWQIPLRGFVREDLPRTLTIAAVMATTGPLIALATPAIGAFAVPLFLWPLAMAVFGLRRAAIVERTYRETVLALSRLTDDTGHTNRGHATRVSRLAVAVARQLAAPDTDLQVVENAALLHDVGQVTLSVPIPGGATVLVAPDDQRRIALDSARIIERTGLSPEVGKAVIGSLEPFRKLREQGEPIPLAGRILKACNAYDDLTQGRQSPAARSAALERINLGLGYDYDPACVQALAVVTGSRAAMVVAPPSRPQRH